VGWALGVVVAVLATTVISSIWSKKNSERKSRRAA
jgi:hypothetical protein